MEESQISDDTSHKSLLDCSFENASEAEDYEDYKVSGYHPVYINENINKYQVVQKLGWGHFSTVKVN
jgi:hypothetical protein